MKVKRQKEIRAARLEARRIHKLEFDSACIIQRMARKFLRNRSQKAAKIILSFIR